MADPQKHAPFSPVLQCKFGYSRSNHMSVFMEICQKNLTHHVPPLLKVIGSLELTWIDRLS